MMSMTGTYPSVFYIVQDKNLSTVHNGSEQHIDGYLFTSAGESETELERVKPMNLFGSFTVQSSLIGILSNIYLVFQKYTLLKTFHRERSLSF